MRDIGGVNRMSSPMGRGRAGTPKQTDRAKNLLICGKGEQDRIARLHRTSGVGQHWMMKVELRRGTSGKKTGA